MLEDFFAAVDTCYADTEEFISIHHDEVVELFETGSAIVLLNGAACVIKLEVTKL